MKIRAICFILGLLLAISHPVLAQRSGSDVLDEKLKQFRSADDFSAKKELYDQMISEFPPNEENQRSYDYVYSDLAAEWLKQENVEKYRSFAGKVSQKRTLMYNVQRVLMDWAKDEKNLSLAEEIAGQYLDEIEQQKGKDSGYAARFHAQYADTYALILHKLGDHEKALEYARTASETYRRIPTEFTNRHAAILAAVGNQQEALDLLASAVRDGGYNDGTITELKAVYSEMHDGMDGYDDFRQSLERKAYEKAREKMAEKKFDEPKPAPSFTLKNMEGESVSLEDYKGKVVVVDFWATWCGPCKRSFPGMQQAVNIYEDDPDVEFLFIDTWEKMDNPLPEVREYINENGYTFHVLFDNESKVVEEFGVSGIPTKFVIDGEGNIWFKSVGAAESEWGIANNMRAMVELTREEMTDSE